MRTNYTISLSEIISEFSLETLNMPSDPEKIQITTTEVNRPGLHMAGYFEFFDEKRIQIIGKSEESFLLRFTTEKAEKRLREFFSHKPSAVVICRNMQVDEVYAKIAAEYGVPLLRTAETTSDFTSALIAFLNLSLAPRVTRHGVLVEVYGEGILLLGESGVGKSETAIELIKRGHRFIADDAVELRKVSAKSIVGTAPEILKYYIELRGIGIVDVRRLFGMGSVKATEKIDMVINLEPWVQGKMYDRLGLETDYTDIMGIKIPMTTIPVKPGRNLAVVLEIAAMNNRQKKMGYNTAEEFNQKLMQNMGINE